MSSSKESSCCIFCSKYLSNETFQWIGYCNVEGKIIVSKTSCDKFSEVDWKKVLNEKGWIHCLTCKKAFYSETELMSHAGHILASEVCSDDVAAEDSPCGD
ncbi:MAG: hypothetical protein H5T50_00985 [Nitrososphaeria archaeon]|nr:hypothetical protein [Nitrososphaeria archaeon]